MELFYFDRSLCCIRQTQLELIFSKNDVNMQGGQTLLGVERTIDLAGNMIILMSFASSDVPGRLKYLIDTGAGVFHQAYEGWINGMAKSGRFSYWQFRIGNLQHCARSVRGTFHPWEKFFRYQSVLLDFKQRANYLTGF